MASGGSTGARRGLIAPDGGIRLLLGGLAGAEDGPVAVDARMHARVALLRGEAREITAMLLHPVAEALPEGERLGLGKGNAVDEDPQTSRAHDLRSARTSLACFETSTSR